MTGILALPNTCQLGSWRSIALLERRVLPGIFALPNTCQPGGWRSIALLERRVLPGILALPIPASLEAGAP